jgi:Flp pilus assembly pilin Flp
MRAMTWDIFNQEGQSTTEYSLIIAFVALIIIVSLGNYGDALYDIYQSFVKVIP